MTSPRTQDPLCIICLQGIDTLIYNGLCNCKPIIHTKCLDEWFKSNSETCPICRIKYTNTHTSRVLNSREQESSQAQEPNGLHCCFCVATFILIILILMFI